MRKVHATIGEAFKRGEAFNTARASTDGETVFLHGHPIFKRKGDKYYLSLAGWPTPTTRGYINALCLNLGLNGGVSQVKGKQMYYGYDIPIEMDVDSWYEAN